MNCDKGAGARLVARMVLVALVVGVSVTSSATERVNLSLVISGALGWSFVPVLQLVTGLLVVRRPSIGAIASLDKYFATGWPWLLWILALHAVFILFPATHAFGRLLMLTAVAPMLWTVRLLMQLCRHELGLDARTSLRRVLVHQGVTYSVVFAYISIAVALWPRIVGLFE